MAQSLWQRLIDKPTYDKLFYVPFWDCPYGCDFCCVDSLPGKPPSFPDSGEALLFNLVDELYKRHGNPIELHLYGGEPMMRRSYVEHLAQKVDAHPHIAQFFLYTTLRSGSPEGVFQTLGTEKLTIIVNPDTVNEKVEERLEQYKEVVKMYDNPVFFPTGRGAVGEEGNQPNLLQRILPIGLPGRSCFARSSGLLVNGQQGTVHLCCLPQSPIVGTFHDSAEKLLDRYEEALVDIPKQINKKARERGCVHPCQVCNSESGYKSTEGVGCNNFDLSAWGEIVAI